MRYEYQKALAHPWENKARWVVVGINYEAARHHIMGVGYQCLFTHAHRAFAIKHVELLNQALTTHAKVSVSQTDEKHVIFLVEKPEEELPEEVVVEL